MIRTLAVIAVIIVVAVAALLGYAATKPDTFAVQRSARIKAQPETIYALIEDFHRWNVWSPYEKLDPAMTRNYSGAATGKGSIYEWSGNSKAGAGRMEITDTTPPSKIVMSLDFTKPFKTSNIVEFTFEPDGDATKVTWTMHGPSPFISKVMGTLFDMDKMIGKDFETGLADLKAASEKQAGA